MLHLISLQCCRVVVSVVVVLLCGLSFSFWWRIFHEACRHESQVFHKSIALERAEAVLSGQTEGIRPLWISAVAAGSMFFECLARSPSMCLCPRCFPKWVNLSMWEHLEGNQIHWRATGAGVGRESPTPSHIFVLCLDAGSGKVPACRERDGHAAVHPVSHAGQSATSGVQPERRDSHQAGPVLRAGRHSQAAGNRSRFFCLSFFVVSHHTFHKFRIRVPFDWFWKY